ncbi:Hsp70 family protein [Stratiformator vulcanicus]|uniref:Chaperone protein DnaK n=1 Tax=Stratiformator vulcanicus TaxID=2527980 RepID=A0A517R1N8_9PLAN|nr:Hsp70 family protein [Stratiformator vulcanicus]QDT37786.1 Chaperone protein DnaK [Stratiformator vulcanicus]
MSKNYCVGIDLGTTNNVLAFAATSEDDASVELLGIPQLVSPGTVETRSSLPSFHYAPAESEQTSGAFDLPWASDNDFVVGEYARRRSAEAPDRVVSAAKSWLCHGKVDRHADILPWQAPKDVAKVSPVEVSRRFIAHLVGAWEANFPDAPLAEQHVALTVPASFDAAARELTREAALAAGLPNDLILLEEPQAAIYAWLHQAGDSWRKQANAGDRILVCDVGGGTTDLTLVSVEDEAGDLTLKRIAVGDHLLVGGDNMDLALAHRASQLFADKGVKLDPWQSVSLWHACRGAKEQLLTADAPDSHSVSVLGRGSKLIGGTVTVDLPRTATEETLLDGFFPDCEIDNAPQRQRTSGFQEIGLPYESDPAITKHIAAFLTRHGEDEPVCPSRVLVNGGVFKSAKIAARLLSVIDSWFGEDVSYLQSDPDLDHAVAKGAAFYAQSKQQGGIRIRGGTARSYYVGIESSGLAIPGLPRPLRALCVVPFGMEEGSSVEVPSTEVGVVVGEPAQFRFFSSPSRKQDAPGDLLPGVDDEELAETDPLETTLEQSDDSEETFVPVSFEANVTELGMLELWCRHAESDRRWKLEFSVRDDVAEESQ